MSDLKDRKGIIAWFASNHVASNLLMFFIITAGILSIFGIKKEIFPEFSTDLISISVEYRGATPGDVESGVILRIEEAIAGIEGVKQINATAAEGMGTVMVEVEEYADSSEVLDDVKAAVDRITTFPGEIEEPVIAEVKNINPVVTIVISGQTTERTLKELAEEVRNDLTSKQDISQVSISGIRPYEISIEVSEQTLRRYGITFDQVAQAIAQASLDLPAGQVKTPGGDILIRTQQQRYKGKEFEEIIVLTQQDGTKIRLSDIATVRDEFEDIDLYTKFNGQPAAMINVSRIGDQGALDISDAVKEYIDSKRPYLPTGIKLSLWEDHSEVLRSRISLLARNARTGLILVFLCLFLFLDLKLAFWTTMGILISFLGAFWIMPMFDVSINMISLFALIMALGIVVDDAIVVGENIFNYQQQGMPKTQAAIKGAREMAAPVTLAVLTTMFAFLPLAYTLGIMGKILRVLPIVVVSVLGVSLVEALLILPAHLSSRRIMSKDNFIIKFSDNISHFTEKKLQIFINGKFARLSAFCIKWRYATVSVGLAVLLATVGVIASGYIKFVFFGTVEADNIIVNIEMPQGTPVTRTEKVVEYIESKIPILQEEFDRKDPGETPVIKHISTMVGAQPATDQGPGGDSGASTAAHLAQINLELLEGEKRQVSSVAMKNRWRELIGEIPGVSSLTFQSEIISTGEAINIELIHQNFDKTYQAAEEVKNILRNFEGVTDITDSFVEGKTEIKLRIKDTARPLGLTNADLARQVRQAFYGEEVQRVQRGRNDIRVMVRYPELERESIGNIEQMRIRLPDGTEVPFKTVADVTYGTSYANIKRVDRNRVINVTADVDESVVNSTELNQKIYNDIMPKLAQQYPGLRFRPAGEVKARNESLLSLKRDFPLALLAIFALLAVQFKSYIQPIIVMSAIPFGIVGATLGHIFLGFDLSILSLFGIVALSGVVVNDSLIMIDLINNERSQDIPLPQILKDCATRRFRPIMLTTLTTFFGLVPMMLERSLQARFLIPMAISLAFGVLFATCITLLLVPALYMILEDVKRLTKKAVS